MKILKHLGLITLLLSTSSAHADNSELLVNAAMERLKHQVRYDGAYVKLDYPMGDVPANTGVCTDVVIRSYRQLGIDFQQLVHEDIKANFNQYPSKRNWGLTRPDKNIDHRRVPNLQAFFKRHGKSLAVTKNGDDYKAGDLVTWMVNGSLPHIGIVVKKHSADGKRPMIVHNIGRGPELEDMLFNYPITGHYRY
ncbi:MAG: DUF1287 domain-containing protein [Psychrobium sp.]